MVHVLERGRSHADNSKMASARTAGRSRLRRRPLRPGERRSPSVWAPSFRFGFTAFAIWRAIHALVVVGLGGPVFRFAWDGYWYERIALHGYRPLRGDDAQGPTAFFPLLSWLTRTVQVVVRSNTAAASIVTTTATVAAIILVHRI